MSMADETFTFHKTKYFWKFVNKQFDLTDMNDRFDEVGEGDYTFLLAEQVPADIYTCINKDTGCLDEDANGLALLDLEDVYTNLPNDAEMPNFKLKCTPINDWDGGFTIGLNSGEISSIQIEVGDSQNIYLQGIFLVKRETALGNENFVMAYATIPSPIKIRNFINLPYNGVFVGVGYCNRIGE